MAVDQAQRVAEHPWAERLFRTGLVAKAVLYAVVGVMALAVALDLGGRTTDTAGALQTLARQPFGAVLVGVLAGGLLGYALWRGAQAALDIDGEGSDIGGIVSRVGAAGSAVVHLGLLVLALRLLADPGSGTASGRQERETTAGVLGWPGGRALVIVAALVVLGVAVHDLREGVTRRFMDRVRVHGSRRRLVERLGIAGFTARGVVFGLVAVFLLKAAVEFDASEAVGVDGALGRLADASYGAVLLGIVAVGLVAYAFTCLAWARHREV